MKDTKPIKPDNFIQFARNGRWGTCAGCPRDTLGNVFPEFCEFTKRYDHQLGVDELISNYKRSLG